MGSKEHHVLGAHIGVLLPMEPTLGFNVQILAYRVRDLDWVWVLYCI